VRRVKRLPLEELAPYLLAVPEQAAPLDWHAVFGNDRRVEIEVGFGKGLFLLTSAQARVDTNFVGIEILRKYQLFTATRLAKRGLRNVKLAHGDARLLLRDRVLAASVQALHVYFPDPWWKTRHHKRRVFTPAFVQECERVLVPGGRLRVATDVEDYFRLIVETVADHTQLRPAGPSPELTDCRTNFERKAREQGKPIFTAVYER
jgi:tRNA (guanine-N7-)-methyltransferase